MEKNENINNENETNQNEDQIMQNNKEEPIKRLFNHERVKKYFKGQVPTNKNKEKFLDQLFPPFLESLQDRSIKSDGTDKINVNEIDWKKSSELFQKLTLFPKKMIKNISDNNEHYIDFKINFKVNKGELFSHYTHFFQAVSLMTNLPGLIEKIFKTKVINEEGCYELYIYLDGEYQIIIIDDYFPVVKGTNTLRFSKPNKEEIWLPLIEKAFSKAHGGYGSLISCDTSTILSTFTGFPVEKINLFDIDIEDLVNVIKRTKNTNYIYLIPNKEKCKEIGISAGKAYQIKEIYDIKTTDNEGKDKIIYIIKIFNMFEYEQYIGKWSKEGDSFTEEIKKQVNFDSSEKMTIYMSVEYAQKYFSQIHIIYKLSNCNIRQISISKDIINIPQVFNLYLPNDSKVSFSLVMRTKNENEISDYEKSLTNTRTINPACICFSQYIPEEKKYINFEGCYNSEEGPETARDLKAGYYVIWTFIAYEFCKEPKPYEYDLKVCCHEYFKLKLQTQDIKYHLLKNLLYNGIKQYQGEFMNNEEICVMDDNYYNFSGLGFEVIVNPFKDYYQKWVFKNQVKNMILLYPFSKFEHFEIQVMPNNGFFLIVGIKLDNTKKCKFSLKSFFKTLKYEPEETESTENLEINFSDFCSEEVKEDERDFKYYQFLNDEGVYLESQEFKTDKVVYDHLYNNYTSYMHKINELKVEDQEKETKLKFIEQKNLDGVFVGQVDENNEKWGRGAFINNSKENYFIGYWKYDKKNGKGTEYNKNGKEISSGLYKNGYMNGQGMKFFEDGTKYEGLFIEGKMDGLGIYTFPDGSQWQGPSIKGIKNGKGTFIDKQGNKSDKEYHNNMVVQ